MRYEPKDLSDAAHTLRSGGILIYPTDTVWGIGCDATNAEAVARLNALKQRPKGKSFIVLVQAEYELSRYVEEVPEIVDQMIQIQEQPMTIIYPKGKGLAPGVAAENGSVAIRLTDDPFCIELIKRTKIPLVSTSANFSGERSPKHFGEISSELKRKADYVCAFRQGDKSPQKPSSVIKIDLDGRVAIIRS